MTLDILDMLKEILIWAIIGYTVYRTAELVFGSMSKLKKIEEALEEREKLFKRFEKDSYHERLSALENKIGSKFF